jgi:hypothetical protein
MDPQGIVFLLLFFCWFQWCTYANLQGERALSFVVKTGDGLTRKARHQLTSSKEPLGGVTGCCLFVRLSFHMCCFDCVFLGVVFG